MYSIYCLLFPVLSRFLQYSLSYSFLSCYNHVNSALSLLLCVNVCICGVFFDELSAWFHVVAHEHGEDFVGFCCILNIYLLQESGLWVHGSVPKLFRVHLSKTFVSLCVNVLVIVYSVAVFVEERLSLLLCVAVFLNLVLEGAEVKWWCCDVEVTFLYDFRHETVEECHDEGVDV